MNAVRANGLRGLLVAVSVSALSASLPAQDITRNDSAASDRLRVIVETDAGGDPDDEQSMVRFLLYVNEWDVEGIIVTRPDARDGENLNSVRTGMGIVRQLIDAYGKCHPHLVEHDRRFPAAEKLLERTVVGYEGDAGPDLVIRTVDADDPRPVWFLNWGTDEGSVGSSLRRTLDRVLKERGPEGYARFKSRIRLSSDDKFGDHTWKIAPPFPLWIDTFRPEVDRKRWYHRFSGLTAKAGGFDLNRDLLNDHGPLGALYPTNTTHPQKEGDTMTFLYLVPTGMNDPDHPGWGSWAGRYGLRKDSGEREYYWADQPDSWQGTTHRDNTLARFAADLQNDFKARLDWCVKPFKEANHPPVVKVDGSFRRSVKPGDRVKLDASATTDPDNDQLKYHWWIYPEAGTCSAKVGIENEDAPRASVVVPKVDSTAELHVVLTVTDEGSPPLPRYARVVLMIEPK